MIGTTISHYKVLEKIGEGGMGEVFLAQDTRLDRKVALKFLPEELQEDPAAQRRFLREAKSAAALDHPFICHIHEVGEAEGKSFIAMEYVQGGMLREKLAQGPMPVREAMETASEIAEALEAAHKANIVHRDLKPSNIMLTSEGHVKVMDFGLAKRVTSVEGQEEGEEEITTKLTKDDSILGTVPYMSPEQLRGHSVDARSDIFSFGVVLYEMLTGINPFKKGGQMETANAILSETAPSLTRYTEDVPVLLQHSVKKMLAKDRDRRYQSLHEVRTNLLEVLSEGSTGAPSGGVETLEPLAPRGFSGGTWMALAAVVAVLILIGFLMFRPGAREAPENAAQAPPEATAMSERKMIVVLPFDNLGSPEDAYFADGMTEEIISRLGTVSGLGVISRRSAFRYADTDKSTREIGEELGVDYILSGGVRWASDGGGSSRVRITPELISVVDDIQLWSEPYDRVIEDIFEVQSEISEQVIEQLGVTLLEGERVPLTTKPTENLEAYTLYLRGRHFWNKRTAKDVAIGLTYFQQAVELDPGYALAHVGIADVWISRGWYSLLAPKETFPKAKQAVLKALESGEMLAEPHASRAHIYLEFDHDWEAANREYERAIELNPRYPTTHQWYGGYLSAMGRHEEALEQARRARELDPLSLIINTWVGLRHYFAGRYDVAIEEYENALELDPDFEPAHWHLGWALEQTGQYDEAIAEAQEAIDLSGGNPLYIASLGHAYAKAGRHEEAKETLDRLDQESRTRHVSAYHIAVIHGTLGDADEAFRWLDRAYEEKSPWIGYLRVDPRIDGRLRSDPRFEMLLQQARLDF